MTDSASKDHLRTLYGYHAWATDRVLASAAKVAEADYFAAAGLPHDSLHGLLFHMVRTQDAWLAALRTGQQPAQPLQPDDYSTLDAVAAGLRETTAQLIAYLEALEPAALDQPIALKNWRGEVWMLTPWRVLQQLILHGQQHRAEIALLTTRYGQSPGDLDFIFYPGG